jgi:hypothetical protein
MSSRKGGKFRVKTARRPSRNVDTYSGMQIEPEELAKRERYFEFFLVVVLLAFGIYHSVLYFGHQTVPTSDFPAFARPARSLLSLKAPSSFKRVPVLGFLQVFLGWLVGGPHPDLTGGWLLNSLLHPLNLILLWLIGKKIVGRSAVWIAVLTIINPQLIQLLADPIVETTFLFFILLTLYLIIKRSRWGYVLASITTMVRYEGAALIMTAFVMDMIYSRSRRERIWACVYSAVAAVPLALWMLGTFLNWQSQPSGHYLHVMFSDEYTKMFDAPLESRLGVVKNMNLLWHVGFQPLLMPHIKASRDFVQVFWGLGKFVIAGGFFFGSVYGLCRRRWDILALLLFFVPYFLLHSGFQALVPRYYMPVFWVALLMCWFGLQSLWNLIDKNGRVPEALVLTLQVLVVIVAIIWLISLVPYLPRLTPVSKTSASFPYVAITVVVIILAGQILVYKPRDFSRRLSILVLSSAFIVSNQFTLVRMVGNGQHNFEFKLLADWYIAKAEPGERMVATLSHITQIYVPKYKDCFVQSGSLKAQSPSDFVRKCYDRNINYVAWDSRLGMAPGDRYYKIWGLEHIAMLSRPRSIGPYEFVDQIRVSERRFINIFRLRREDLGPAGKNR